MSHSAFSLPAEMRAAIVAMRRNTGYVGPTQLQIEDWALRAEALECELLNLRGEPQCVSENQLGMPFLHPERIS